MKKLRVRFAPSPTGALHLGGLRTALYNYLLAKKNGGDFILRIEDTDQNRFVLGAEKYLLEALNWCGLIPDESPYHRGEYGPYRQSERKSIYAIYFQYLIEKGHAYYAFDTEEILDEKREKCQKQGAIFAYNAKTRLQMQNSLSLTAQQIKNRIDKGDPYVVRFKTPINNEVLTIQDQIRGEIKINTDNIDDKVLVKSNGVPTYHLANVVDDHLMKITHVIRGEEWLSSLPLHLLLYRAMEWEAPYFAHLPLILKPQGKGKLSKRDINMGFPIFPIKWIDPQTGTINYGYREEGYFPEAFINMLALLGWNPGDEREILSLKELIDLFSLNQVSKSNAHFSKEKAEWFNQQYLQRKSLKELTKLFEKELKKHQINSKQEYSEKVIKAVKERAHFIHDIWEMSSYFFIAPVEYKYKAFKRIWKKESLYIVKHLINHLSNQQDWSFHRLKKDLEDFVRIQKINFTNLIQLLRLALVGDLKGVDIFFIMEMLGLEETIARINRFIEKASKQKNLI